MKRSKSPILVRYQEHFHSGIYRNALEIFEAIEAEGFFFDIGSEKSRAFFGAVSPKVGLETLTSIQSGERSDESDYSFVNPATGSWIHIKKVLAAIIVKELSVFCDQCFQNPGTPPRRLQTIAEDQESAMVFAKFGVVALLKNLAREVQPSLGQSLTILTKRTFLRRTYPVYIKYKDPLKNIHNQNWHQDSNPAFGDRPMLTIWIPLQSESGISRPGLSIMKAPINRFHPDLGDGCEKAKVELEQELGEVEIETPLVDAGDAIVFNGLTFHQTFSTNKMLHHRDALVIRIVRSHEARYFPIDHKDDVVVKF